MQAVRDAASDRERVVKWVVTIETWCNGPSPDLRRGRAEVPEWLVDGIAATGISGLWVTREDGGEIPDFRGAYVLGLRLDEEVPVALPRSAAGRLVPG